MRRTLGEIAEIVRGELIGDKNLVITELSGIKEAQAGALTFVSNSKYFSQTKTTKASAILTPRDMSVPGKSIIRTDDPSLAFAQIIAFEQNFQFRHPKGIHPQAIIAEGAVLGKEVAVGPFVVIESGAEIGDRTVIYAGSYIGYDSKVGADCLIHPHVTIREKVTIGKRVIIHCGTVIGSDGFGYIQVDGVHQKIPQVGTVVIEDDVEIGANVTIDRARFDTTLIGKGTKIDNLVQIAHNVQIGERCLIVAQVGIAGSSIIEKNVTLAGQAGVAGHLTIGEGAVVASQSGVTKSVPPGMMVSGYPAKPHLLAKRVNASLQRLPVYVQLIRDLADRLQQLEERFKNQQSK